MRHSISEYPIGHTSNINHGFSFKINCSKFCDVLDTVIRDNNVYISVLDHGDDRSHHTRQFRVYSAWNEVDYMMSTPHRYISKFQTEKPSWWEPSNGPWYPTTYYIFEVHDEH